MTPIERAQCAIARAVTNRTSPALLCSFGKDSLVMLDLLAPFGVRRVLHCDDADEIVQPVAAGGHRRLPG